MIRTAQLVPMLLLAFAAPARNEPVEPPVKLIVFANRSTPVNKLTTGQLRSVLLGEVPQWSNGRAVTLLLVEDQSLKRALKTILKMSKDDYLNHFMVSQYQGGELVKPKLVPTVDAALQYLTSTPGAIAVLSGEPDMTVAGAKAVRIDGKLPDDEGYRY
jgi:hypothetical protein